MEIVCPGSTCKGWFMALRLGQKGDRLTTLTKRKSVACLVVLASVLSSLFCLDEISFLYER